MGKHKNQQSQIKKRHYSTISRSVKEKLIKKVVYEGYSLSSASKQYKIKLTTVKAIVSKFRATQEISQTSKQLKKRIEKQANEQKMIENNIEHEPIIDEPMIKFLYFWNPYFCMWMMVPL